MRSLFLRALVVLVILAVGYALLQRSEGYVLITVAGYAFEMTFAIAVLHLSIVSCASETGCNFTLR